MRYFLIFAAFSALFALSNCKSDSAHQASGPDQKDLPMPADPLFKTVQPEESGITFKNTITEDFDMNVMAFAYLYNGGGVGVIDFNNDGLQDVFFTSTSGECKLYQNNGNLKFTDVTTSAGVAAPRGIKSGVAIADVNGDGWQDIYLCRTGPKLVQDRENLLFINNHNGTFTESARQYGLNDAAACSSANFFDYDNDGDLDLYVLAYPDDSQLFNKLYVKDFGGGDLRRVNEPSGDFDGDRLYRNNGNGSFTNVSKEAGIWNHAFGLSVNTVDMNGDGWLDIYVCNDYVEPDFYYVNNKNGTFTEKNLSSFRHTTESSMGSDIADVNNDGMPDVMALDMLSEDYVLQKERITSRTIERYNTLNKYGYGHQQERNVLNLNNGDGSFSDVACIAGIFQTDWSWSILAPDLDNDGWKDIYVTNGYRRDITNADYIMFTADSIHRLPGGVGPKNFKDIYEYLDIIPEHRLQNFCFRNKGDLTYENVSTNWGFVQKSFSNGAAYADLDNDGDLDLLVNNIEREAFVYQNTSADKKSGNWLQIKVAGDGANLFALGAKARITCGGEIQYQQLTPTHGFLSSSETIFHFGLGNAAKVDKIEVEFPGNRLIVQENLSPNQRLVLLVADAKPGRLAPLPVSRPLVADVTGNFGLNYKHTEDDYLDFNAERLIPWKISTPGPAITTGDVNGDGHTDFYIGGAAGTPGALMIQSASGIFRTASADAWTTSRTYEDTGAVFFDADGDGDQDLFVSSGSNGVGNNGNPVLYAQRLYINDGKGSFSRSLDGLPEIYTSCGAVTACDYDGDGDQDIFLGGYCIPGAYPKRPASYILQNNGGKFTDVTKAAGQAFGTYGMVRSMVWADLDGDKKSELVVVGEWAPVAVYQVAGGVLQDKTEQFGLAGTEGFWRSITAADVDGDGDQDLIAGNLGLNTRLHATTEAPLEIFASDFDANGSIDPLMTIFYNGDQFPLATRDLLIKQLPLLKKKFVRYTPYARATIDDIYSKEALDRTQHLRVNTLTSFIFINNNGKFTAQPLPNEAQVAPVYASVVTDLNGDKIPDIITVGNDYGQQVETGRIDSGNGCILLGDGQGHFKPVPPRESGFWAAKEARSLQLVKTVGKSVLLVGNSNDILQAFSF